MTTVFENANEGSSRANCVFMAHSNTGQLLVRNPSRGTSLISASYARLSQKTGQVLVRTPRRSKTRISAAKRGYVRRSEITYARNHIS